jgi:hypothetical protein
MEARMMISHKTRSVCNFLNVRYSHLTCMLRDGRLAPPAKDESGDFVWLDSDIQRAREALAMPRRKRQMVKA